MLSCIIVASREQTKKINKKLNASQVEESQKLDESSKPATEGEEPVSFQAEQVTSRFKFSNVASQVAENLEKIFVLVGTIVGVESVTPLFYLHPARA